MITLIRINDDFILVVFFTLGSIFTWFLGVNVSSKFCNLSSRLPQLSAPTQLQHNPSGHLVKAMST